MGKNKIVRKTKGIQILTPLELFVRKVDNITGESIYKCRFVARGDLEKKSKLEKIYSPVAGIAVTRVFLALAAHHGWNVRQCDISSAFLYGELNREIYLELPDGLKEQHGKDHCWTTRRSIYGPNDAPKAWHLRMKTFLINFGFTC